MLRGTEAMTSRCRREARVKRARFSASRAIMPRGGTEEKKSETTATSQSLRRTEFPPTPDGRGQSAMLPAPLGGGSSLTISHSTLMYLRAPQNSSQVRTAFASRPHHTRSQRKCAFQALDAAPCRLLGSWRKVEDLDRHPSVVMCLHESSHDWYKINLSHPRATQVHVLGVEVAGERGITSDQLGDARGRLAALGLDVQVQLQVRMVDLADHFHGLGTRVEKVGVVGCQWLQAEIEHPLRRSRASHARTPLPHTGQPDRKSRPVTGCAVWANPGP